MMNWDFSQVGGVQVAPGTVMRVGGNDVEQSDGTLAWNFGISTAPAGVDVPLQQTFWQAFPNLQGRWDGKTRINHHESVRKALGKDIDAQKQPKGTCGGRSGSLGVDLIQCILIASGKRAKFRRTSHAWPYFLARREFNMLGGGDGVADGSIPPVLAKFGALHREEAGDTDYNSGRSDDLAAAWGGGRLDRAKAAELEGLAKDNIVTISAPVKSAAEMADAIASGGVIVCSDDRGYSMRRDAEGICSPQGTWYHYHVRSGVGVTPRGRKVFDYNQSWGQNTPDGPRLDGCPDHCFGVEWDVDDQNTRRGTFHAIFGFDLWDLESGKIPWTF
jgi:hypothetical protein